jgi:hypothetical protein
MIERVGIWELCGKVRVLNIGVREGWDRMGGLGIKYIISMSVHRRSKQLVFNDYNEVTSVSHLDSRIHLQSTGRLLTNPTP